MWLLEEILNEMLLTESVSVEDVDSAIDNHERIIINYHTKGEDEHTGARVIEVYAYGLTKAGNEVIRAFQPYGDSTSKVPSWKFFRLDRISSWKPTGQIFSHPIDFYDKSAPKFNPNGDDTMSVIYKIADFGNKSEISVNNVDNGPKINRNNVDSEPYKTDTERNMERLKNQLNNPIKLSDIKTNDGFKGVDFDKTQENGPKVKETQPYKTDTERGLDNLKKQLDNPTKIDLSKFDKKYNKDEISDLRDKLGDTSEPISFSDLQQRLNNDKTEEKPVDDTYKTDTERGLDNLKKQLDNPTKIDLSRIPKR